MQFKVGPFHYRLVVSDRAIFDVEGNELEGCALEARRIIIISRIVEPDRREEIARHEHYHAWLFHIPKPADEEAQAKLVSMTSQLFDEELDAQGGREALKLMQPSRIPQIGRPAMPGGQGASVSAREVLGSLDRVDCACCGAVVMCGSIHTSEAVLHQPTGKFRVERWFQCDGCGSVQVWQEVSSSDGCPLAEYVASPPPRLLRGMDAARFLAERAEVAA